MKIGIFDTGVGGVVVARELEKAFPSATILTANDSKNVPYSGRPRAEILSLTKKAIAPLLSAGCDVIVIACNTITTQVLSDIRSAYPDMHFVG
ncbi:MAG TPA: glutamate racemase, partial [Candidatus Saccharibacteria bacterium]|nr:glutamate racemase [Candidatus Saccharibacteria bacterium]